MLGTRGRGGFFSGVGGEPLLGFSMMAFPKRRTNETLLPSVILRRGLSFFDPHAVTDLPIHPRSSPARPRGVVAVVTERGRFLVIRRSSRVVAPGAYCFPGGAIESGESEEEALVREIREELGTTFHPLCRVWESITPWGIPLAWWQGSFEPGVPLVPNPNEVASAHWHTLEEMARLPGLLESNLAFLDALASGLIRLQDM